MREIKYLKKWWIYPIIMGLMTLIFPYSSFGDAIGPYFVCYFFSLYILHLRKETLPLPKDKKEWSGNDKVIRIQMVSALFFLAFGGGVISSIYMSIYIPIGEYIGIFGFEKVNYFSPFSHLFIFIIYIIIMFIIIVLFVLSYSYYIIETGWGEKYWPKETKDELRSTGSNGTIII